MSMPWRTQERRRFTSKRARLNIELLEARTLLSTWVAMGPAPILNGNVPGNLPLSGRITAVAAHPSDPDTFYIAAAGGGVWKTQDGGDSWTPLTDDQPTLFMGALTLAPTDPNVIYAGTGEANGLSNNFLANVSPSVFAGRGVLKSTDGGATWQLLGNDVFNRRSIAKIVVDSTTPDVVYVAVGQPGINGLIGNQGIWKSADGGKTWTNTTAASGVADTVSFSDVVMDPADNQHLFAGTGGPNSSPFNGLYETRDGGANWALATGDGTFPTVQVGRITLTVSSTNPKRLYASIIRPGTLPSSLLRMLRSDDGGKHWVTLAAPNYVGQQGFYDTTLIVDPKDPDRVYAGGQGGPGAVIESTDAGSTWTAIAVGASGKDGPHNDHHGMAFDAAGRLLDGNDGGMWRLEDADVAKIRWSDLNTNLQITTFIGIALHPTDPNIAYGGSQDTGTEIFTGDPAWYQVRTNDGGFVRVDPSNPNVVYHEFLGVSLERSDDGGFTWEPKTAGISGGGNFYVPYVLDAGNPARLLLGTTRVNESSDRGDHWSQISTPGQGGWGPGSAIDSLAAAPTDSDTIYASAGGHIYVTTTHGVSWTQVDIPGYTDHFFDLKVDPTDSHAAYAVRGLYGGGHVFRTSDGGLHWDDISGNLPDLPAFSLALGAGNLYLGTDAGVFSSDDGGQSWNALGDGLPHAQAKELVLNPDLGILAAGTHGRGFWELSLFKPASGPLGLLLTNRVSVHSDVAPYQGAVSLAGSNGLASWQVDFLFAVSAAGAVSLGSRARIASVNALQADRSLGSHSTRTRGVASVDGFFAGMNEGDDAGSLARLPVELFDGVIASSGPGLRR